MRQVKVFDEEHEDDLTESINAFLSDQEDSTLLDIKFSVAVCNGDEGQIFCFSALLIYEE